MTKIAAIFAILLGTCLIPSSAFCCINADGKQSYSQTHIVFSGQVSGTETYTHEIMPSLFFHLTPTDRGWEIGMDDTQAPKEAMGYIYPVTPPYRFNGTLYIDGSYDTEHNPLKWDEREFSFILKPEDYTIASESMQKILWPKTDNEQQTGLDAIAKLKTGKGTFKILDGEAENIPGPQAGWRVKKLKFEVDLDIPIAQRCL